MKFPFDRAIVLENNIALLRPILITDIENLLPVATQNKDLLRYFPQAVNNGDLLRNYIDSAIENRKKNSQYTFIVFDKTTNEYAGCTSYLNISNRDDRLEIGSTWYGSSFQRTGLNRNCKYLLLEYAFDQSGAARVEFKTDERNVASRRAIEKIGGKFEGILRQHMVMHDGFRRNTIYYSILKDEWPELKSIFPIYGM